MVRHDYQLAFSVRQANQTLEIVWRHQREITRQNHDPAAPMVTDVVLGLGNRGIERTGIVFK